MAARLRLLKLIVQPVYVLDDGDSLVEQTSQPLVLTEAEVARFPEWWAERFEEFRARVEGGT